MNPIPTPGTTLRVREWDRFFENNRTRELKRLDWVPVPNRHDGEGYSLLVTRPNGAALFGAWVLLLEVASRCSPRGTLVRSNGSPHTPNSLAARTRAAPADFAAAIPVLLEIGWLEEVLATPEVPATPPPKQPEKIPHPPATIPHLPALPCGNPAGRRSRVPRREGKGREGKEGKEETTAAAAATISNANEITTWSPTAELLATLQDAYPDLSPAVELRKIRAYLAANPDRMRTLRGMPRFVNAWFARSSREPGKDARIEERRRERGRDAREAERPAAAPPDPEPTPAQREKRLRILREAREAGEKARKKVALEREASAEKARQAAEREREETRAAETELAAWSADVAGDKAL